MVCAVLAPVLPQFQALLKCAAAIAPRLSALASQGGLAVTRPDGSTQPIPVGATPVVLSAAQVATRREVSAHIAAAGFKMAQAVALSKLFGATEVDWALGHTAVHARFAHGDLASILDHHTATTTGPDHRAGEDGSLTQGTSGWAALRMPAIEEPYDDEQEAAL